MASLLLEHPFGQSSNQVMSIQKFRENKPYPKPKKLSPESLNNSFRTKIHLAPIFFLASAKMKTPAVWDSGRFGVKVWMLG